MSEGTQTVSDQIAGAWKQVRRQIRKAWGKLTEDDVEQIQGHRDILAAKIHQRYGIALEEANLEIDKWAAGRKL